MTKSVMTVSMIAAAGASAAQTPQFMWDGGMKHVLITFDGADIGVGFDPNAGSLVPPLEMRTFGESYAGNAGVLDDTYYSSQYGFLADGFISLPAGAAIFIEMTSSSAGLSAYEGGMRPMAAMHTYAPVFGTGGSDAAWQWGGTMHHTWFAADTLGSYSADFEIYIGDALTGAALGGFGSDTITLDWVAVPTPGPAAVFGLGGLLAARRRR